MLPIGSTIGILGGGQLGRMLAVSAAQLGYRVHIFAPEKVSIAAEVSAEFTSADWHDTAALKAFADACDVVTYEFENVPVGPLSVIPAEKLAPSVQVLETAQDRLLEKQYIQKVGGTPAPYAAIRTADDIAKAIETVGLPGIIKTCRDGYDGKGQWRIHSAEDARGITVPESGLVYEGFVTFEAEFSVILARKADGTITFWDSTQNVHEQGILARSFLPPAPIIAQQIEDARSLAKKVADELGYVGVLTLEFFATANGPVFNEMAPRVHNSGHWTIEGAETSQFENHIRAICGLPFGDTTARNAVIEMGNLVGPSANDALDLLADPRCHLHLYGKGDAREGRKMGHFTKLGGPLTVNRP